MVDIKDTLGNIRFSTEINEGSKRKFLLMQEDYITLKFSVPEAVYFRLGDGIDNELGIFELVDIQKPKFNNTTGGYDYELRLDAYYWKWKNKRFKFNPEVGGQEASWSLTASLDVYLGVFLRNLSALKYKYRESEFDFHIDQTVEKSSKPLTYDNVNLIDALSMMAEAWECEWWITDNTINFGRIEHSDPVDFEIGKNVEEMTSSESRTTYATRIYAFGSTRNLPTNYRPIDESLVVNGVVQKRLMLPIGTPCIDSDQGLTNEEAVEDIVVFDDIYPRMVGEVSDITTKEYTETVENEDGTTTENKWLAYRFRDSGITFSEEYRFKDKELKIQFESGALYGLTFEVLFNPDGVNEKLSNGEWNPDAQIWEIKRNEDYVIPLPGDTMIPNEGDKYVLSGYDTSFVSVDMLPNAEQELKEKAEKYIAKTKIDPSTYTCKMMSDYIYNKGDVRLLEAGARVNLINSAYFDSGNRVSRIIGFEYNLDIHYDSPVYTVGETASYSRIGELESKVESITYKGQVYTGSSGSGIYLITLNDSTIPTDRNAYSSKRTVKEIEERALSRKIDDETQGHLTIQGGATLNGLLYANKLINANSGIVAKSNQTSKEISNAVVEETDVEMTSLSTAILEDSSSFLGGTLGSLTNVDNSADEAPDGSLLAKFTGGWCPVHPEKSSLADFDNMLIPVYHKYSGWIFIPASLFSGGVNPPTPSCFPYTFPLILS